MAKERIGLYPGTFDPVTNGHMDIIVRATSLVDKLVVAVAVNTGKGPLFGLEDRVDLLRGEIKDLPPAVGARIEIRPFRSLLMKFVESVGATQIIRGLRAVSDFEARGSAATSRISSASASPIGSRCSSCRPRTASTATTTRRDPPSRCRTSSSRCRKCRARARQRATRPVRNA